MDTFFSTSTGKELIIIFQILYAVILGGFIGVEREKHSMAAGIRTYAAVCLGATVFTLIGIGLADASASSRIISNIITGVGFIGAGIIFRNSNGKSSGLTTAATVWSTAAVGVAVGVQLFLIATFSAIIIWFLLSLHHYMWFNKWVNAMREKHKDCPETNNPD